MIKAILLTLAALSLATAETKLSHIVENGTDYNINKINSLHVVTFATSSRLKRSAYFVDYFYKTRQDHDIPYQITCILTLKSSGGLSAAGDVFFGTTNGLYFRKNGAASAFRINGIEGHVTVIEEHLLGTVIIATNDLKNYYVDYYHKVRQDRDVPYQITCVKTLKSWGGYIAYGDVFFGTTNGLYFRKNGGLNAFKIDGINGHVSVIEEHLQGTVHVATNNSPNEDKDQLAKLNSNISDLKRGLDVANKKIADIERNKNSVIKEGLKIYKEEFKGILAKFDRLDEGEFISYIESRIENIDKKISTL